MSTILWSGTFKTERDGRQKDGDDGEVPLHGPRYCQKLKEYPDLPTQSGDVVLQNKGSGIACRCFPVAFHVNGGTLEDMILEWSFAW